MFEKFFRARSVHEKYHYLVELNNFLKGVLYSLVEKRRNDIDESIEHLAEKLPSLVLHDPMRKEKKQFEQFFSHISVILIFYDIETETKNSFKFLSTLKTEMNETKSVKVKDKS